MSRDRACSLEETGAAVGGRVEVEGPAEVVAVEEVDAEPVRVRLATRGTMGEAICLALPLTAELSAVDSDVLSGFILGGVWCVLKGWIVRKAQKSGEHHGSRKIGQGSSTRTE